MRNGGAYAHILDFRVRDIDDRPIPDWQTYRTEYDELAELIATHKQERTAVVRAAKQGCLVRRTTRKLNIGESVWTGVPAPPA